MRESLGGRQEVGIPIKTVKIAVRRETGYADRLRKYKIQLDGVDGGSLKPGQTLQFIVAPGTHTLRAKIDWCSSNQLTFDATPGKTLVFDCGNNLRSWQWMFAPFFMLYQRGEYLWLRPAA